MYDSEQSISVLLPVFHRENSLQNIALLRRALESIKDQDIRTDYEVLLVDDGSPVPIAQQAELLGAAADDVTWIRIERNGGLVNALNSGIRVAKYRFIARLDADDCWLPTKVEKQLDLFRADPDLTITATGMSLVRPDNTVIEHLVRPGDWGGILNFFVNDGCPFPHGSVIARADIYRLLGGYPHDGRFSHCEDYTLWGTWLRFFKPAMVEECLYNYTASDTSVSILYAPQQATTSRIVNRRFAEGDLSDRLPTALQRLSETLDVSLLEAGRLSYVLWQFRPEVVLPETAIDSLRVILFDRVFSAFDQSPCSKPWYDIINLPCPLNLASQPSVAGRFYPI